MQPAHGWSILLALLLLGGRGGTAVPAPVAGQAVPVRQGLVSLEGARIFYEVVGTGDPVLVVHGGPGLDHNYLRPGLDALAGVAQLIYYDQRGTGRSTGVLDSAHINLDRFVEDMDALREVLGHDRIAVLGHSFGGLLALAYAARFPERTRALVLVAPAEPGRRWRTAAAARLADARSPADSAALAELAASEALAAGDPATVSRYYRLVFRATVRDPAVVDRLNLDLMGTTARNGREVARLLGASVSGVNWDEVLARIQAPTLIVHGRFDPTPTAMARELADRIPEARLVVLETGHFPFVEDPAALVSAVTTFLAESQR
ncbi:MAG: alpha/beta fold hydrolase [Gemmatimonadota bacterium]